MNFGKKEKKDKSILEDKLTTTSDETITNSGDESIKIKSNKTNSIKTHWNKIQIKWRYVIIGSSTAFVALGLTAAIAIPVVLNEVYALMDPFAPTGGSYNFNAAKKRGNKYNVLALGDSVTAGYNTNANSFSDNVGTKEYESYVDFIAADLKQANELNAYTNFAHSGYTTADLRDQVSSKTNVRDSISNADLIYISIGANDLLPLVKALGYNILASGKTDQDTGTGTHPNEGGDKPVQPTIADALNDINHLDTEKQIGSQILGYNYDKEYIYDRLNYIITNIVSTLRDVRKINDHALITFIGYAYPFNTDWDYSDQSTLDNGFPGIPQFFKTFLSTMNDELAGRYDFVKFFNVNDDKDFTKNVTTYMPNHADIHPSIAGQAEIGTKLFENLASEINISYKESNLQKAIDNNDGTKEDPKGVKNDFEKQDQKPKDALQNSNILDVFMSLGDKKRMNSYDGNFAQYIYGGKDDQNIYVYEDINDKTQTGQYQVKLSYNKPVVSTSDVPAKVSQPTYIGNNFLANIKIPKLFSSSSVNGLPTTLPINSGLEAVATLFSMGLGDIIEDLQNFALTSAQEKILDNLKPFDNSTPAVAPQKISDFKTYLANLPIPVKIQDPYFFAKLANAPVVDMLKTLHTDLSAALVLPSISNVAKTIIASTLDMNKADANGLLRDATKLKNKISEIKVTPPVKNAKDFNINYKTYGIDPASKNGKFLDGIQKDINNGTVNINHLVEGYLELFQWKL